MQKSTMHEWFKKKKKKPTKISDAINLAEKERIEGGKNLLRFLIERECEYSNHH